MCYRRHEQTRRWQEALQRWTGRIAHTDRRRLRQRQQIRAGIARIRPYRFRHESGQQRNGPELEERNGAGTLRSSGGNHGGGGLPGGTVGVVRHRRDAQCGRRVRRLIRSGEEERAPTGARLLYAIMQARPLDPRRSFSLWLADVCALGLSQR